VGPLEKARRVIALRESELDHVQVVHEFVAKRGQDRPGSTSTFGSWPSASEPDSCERERIVPGVSDDRRPSWVRCGRTPSRSRVRRDIIEPREPLQQLIASLVQGSRDSASRAEWSCSTHGIKPSGRHRISMRLLLHRIPDGAWRAKVVDRSPWMKSKAAQREVKERT
jgi:hypothetical protein